MVHQLDITENAETLGLPDGTELIDITAELFGSLEHLKDNKVSKSDYFDLLDGTRAIEVTNPRLDTGMIQLSSEDIEFDTASPQSVSAIIAVQNKLLTAYMSWLNNSSLPVTVLSCRYVQTMITNYMKYKSLPLTLAEKCSLVNERLPKQQELDAKSTEHLLVHKVMKSFIIGLCKFIGTTLYIAQTVLYEEEDVTTRTMNLDFLQDEDSLTVIQELEASIHWVADNIQDPEAAELLRHQLSIIINLNKIETILFISINLLKTNNKQLVLERIAFLKDGSSSVECISKNTHGEYEAPPASFSRFIQLDLDNKNIPFELNENPRDESWAQLKSVFDSIWDIVYGSLQTSNFNEFNEFLRIDIGHNIEKFNVIVRGVFQLYLVRDDKTIYGDPTQSLNTVTFGLIENLVGGLTSVLNLNENTLGSLKDEYRTLVQERAKDIYHQLDAGIYHNLTIYGNNQCRQQQLLSRGLLVWDNLQVAWESFEVELYEMFKIGDELPTGDVALSVSSFVYYTKLNMMIDLALNGIILEIYKNFELYLIYWYSNYLIQILIEHIQGRIGQILAGKINYIEKTMPKKIKKTKAGPKKDQLKAANQYNHEVILPAILESQKFHTSYLVPSLQGLNDLIEANRIYLILLSSFNFVDFLKGPKNSLTSFKNLFNLRLKPWSSIGVPALPKFDQYESSLDLQYLKNGSDAAYKPLFQIIEKKLKSSKEHHQHILKSYQGTLSKAQLDWYNSLVKVSISYLLELKNFVKIVTDLGVDKVNPADFDFSVSKGYHKYFPTIKITKKT